MDLGEESEDYGENAEERSVERALDEKIWVRKARPTASSTAVAGKRQ